MCACVNVRVRVHVWLSLFKSCAPHKLSEKPKTPSSSSETASDAGPASENAQAPVRKEQKQTKETKTNRKRSETSSFRVSKQHTQHTQHASKQAHARLAEKRHQHCVASTTLQCRVIKDRVLCFLYGQLCAPSCQPECWCLCQHGSFSGNSSKSHHHHHHHHHEKRGREWVSE